MKKLAPTSRGSHFQEQITPAQIQAGGAFPRRFRRHRARQRATGRQYGQRKT